MKTLPFFQPSWLASFQPCCSSKQKGNEKHTFFWQVYAKENKRGVQDKSSFFIVFEGATCLCIPKGADFLPPLLRVAKTGKNHLNKEIIPLLPNGKGNIRYFLSMLGYFFVSRWLLQVVCIVLTDANGSSSNCNIWSSCEPREWHLTLLRSILCTVHSVQCALCTVHHFTDFSVSFRGATGRVKIYQSEWTKVFLSTLQK